MAMPSKDDRLRMQHTRIENEKQYLRQKKFLESDLGERVSDISRQEYLIKKQQDRLENEKQYNKSHSYLTRDRRLSAHATEGLDRSQTSLQDVKSKLFDYEKYRPRSRRQLIESGSPTTVSPVPRQLATHAIEANKTSHSDIVHHLTLTDSKERDDKRMKTSAQSIKMTDLEQRASRRSVEQPDHKVTFEDGKAAMEHRKRSAARSTRRHSEPVPHIKVTDTGAGRRDVNADDDDDAAVKLQNLYNKAIETVKLADDSLMTNQKTRSLRDRRLSDHRTKSGLDINALKELEQILKDARLYSSRKSSKEDHSRLDLGSNRAQKKRIEHLEQVLRQLNPKYDESANEIDPYQVLQCSYLRLSKSNIETLEDMLRHEGKDPGIHIHSDVTDYDIWKNIQNERTDLNKANKDPKTARPKKSMKID